MRIGLVTDSLGHLDLPTMLDIAAADGIETLEFGCGNWPCRHMRAKSAAKKSVRNQCLTAGSSTYRIDFAHQSAFV
jgi:sugar phosphate isomerase/epimerase